MCAWLAVKITQQPKRIRKIGDDLSVEKTIFPYYPSASRRSLTMFAVILTDACSRGKGALDPRDPIILVLGLLAWLKGLTSEL